MDQQVKDIDYTSLSTEELLCLEKEYKNTASMLDSKQKANKILINALYGALGNFAFRYFDVRLASSVTTSGQLSIRWIERKLNELIDKKIGVKKDRVVLIDTDSVVLDLQDIIRQVEKKNPNLSREQKLKFLDRFGSRVLEPYIEQSYQELADYVNMYEQKMKMKRENIINSMVSVAAKSYIMEVYNSEGVQYTLENPYMKIMGLLLVKSSTPAVMRQALRDSLPILLHGSEDQIQQYIQDVKKSFDDYTIEQIAFPRGITNLTSFDKKVVLQVLANQPNVEDRESLIDACDTQSDIYVKKTPVHVKGSLVYNHLLEKYGLTNTYKKITDGDKVKFVYLKTPNPIHEECIAFHDNLPKEFQLKDYVDYNKMFERMFLSAISKMIAPLGWKAEKESYLEDFFTL